MTDILGKKLTTLSTGEVVVDWFLYCSENCAKVDGCKETKPLPYDADPDETAEECGQLCPICDCEYEFVDRL